MPIDKTKLARRKDLCRELKEKLAESLDLRLLPSDLSDDVSLVGSGLGLDSLDILEIVLCVEKNFGVKMPENGVETLRSLNTLADYIAERRGEQCAK